MLTRLTSVRATTRWWADVRLPQIDASRPFGTDLLVRPRRRHMARRRSPFTPVLHAALGALAWGVFVAVILRAATLAAY